jgi:hypothetical protein
VLAGGRVQVAGDIKDLLAAARTSLENLVLHHMEGSR